MRFSEAALGAPSRVDSAHLMRLTFEPWSAVHKDRYRMAKTALTKIANGDMAVAIQLTEDLASIVGTELPGNHPQPINSLNTSFLIS